MAFVEHEGHTRVRRIHKTEEGLSLGTWLNNQKARRAKLSAKQVGQLEALGWSGAAEVLRGCPWGIWRPPQGAYWPLARASYRRSANCKRFLQAVASFPSSTSSRVTLGKTPSAIGRAPLPRSGSVPPVPGRGGGLGRGLAAPVRLAGSRGVLVLSCPARGARCRVRASVRGASAGGAPASRA
ncbi:helicase associated domain-containing protein [Kitasatospora purpeofusca]|uniref:helicase associated domain-containing protein n=1 Tax=Kitasatospora purpeofusca TaxID=67352 RepID=UPI003BF57B4C